VRILVGFFPPFQHQFTCPFLRFLLLQRFSAATVDAEGARNGWEGAYASARLGRHPPSSRMTQNDRKLRKKQVRILVGFFPPFHHQFTCPFLRFLLPSALFGSYPDAYAVSQ
jgi:hypothetical protein